MAKSKYLVYRDSYISVFNDNAKCLLIFVNDRGQTEVLDYTSNFYSAEEDIMAYDKLIKHATSNTKEQKAFLRKFAKSVEKILKANNETLNKEYLAFYGVAL